MDEEFCRQRLKTVKDLADKADPFIKRRLMDLAERYERRIRQEAEDKTFARWQSSAETKPDEPTVPASEPTPRT
jgi:hypothetical protein